MPYLIKKIKISDNIVTTINDINFIVVISINGLELDNKVTEYPSILVVNSKTTASSEQKQNDFLTVHC